MDYKGIKVHLKYESHRIETMICKPNEKLRDICLSFSEKNHFSFDSVIFILNGIKINQEDFNNPLKIFINKLDKNNVYILIYDILNSENEN